MPRILENVLVKFEELDDRGDVFATPEDKSIFQTIMDYKVGFVPIKGNRIKLRFTKYNKDMNPNEYLGKYGRCILSFKTFSFPSNQYSGKVTNLIIYLNHIDIV